MLKKFLRPVSLPATADWGILILRVGIALLMITHGYAKLGKFLSGDRSFADPIGIGEELSLIMAIGAEFFGSILMILGLATRAVLIPLIFTVSVILFVVHGNDPFENKEHALLFLIPYVTLFFTGPGKYSLDKKLF
jgi:putative oxidoreductase